MRIKKRRLFTGRNYILLLSALFVLFTKNHSAFAQEQTNPYDSSIQRSNFLTTDPRYEKNLDEELNDRRAAFLWKMRFDSQSLQTDQNIQSQIVGATAQTKFDYKILDNLKFKARANLGLESGRSQSIFGDLEPSSGIYPRELKLEFKPYNEILTLNFGQINQRWFGEDLFIGNLGFPGTSQKLSYKSSKFNISLITQQLIPTSSTLSTRVGEKEEVPNLFTESVEATWNLSSVNFIKGRVSHFRYSNLPSVVAFDSFIYGNTVTDADQNNAKFIYDFNGFMYQLTFEQKFSDSLSGQVLWNTISNSKAPSTNGEAQSITGALANDFGRWILVGAYKNYFIESDAVPSYYNSHGFGHNNRLGNHFEMGLESKDSGVIFKASYTKANLLNPTVQRIDGLQQDNQQTIYFSVETMYDFI